jgi:hypothetical protein
MSARLLVNFQPKKSQNEVGFHFLRQRRKVTTTIFICALCRCAVHASAIINKKYIWSLVSK